MNAGKILSLVLFILAVTSVMVNLECIGLIFFFLILSNSADLCCFGFFSFLSLFGTVLSRGPGVGSEYLLFKQCW